MSTAQDLARINPNDVTLSNKEFGERLSLLNHLHKQIVELTKKTAALKKGDVLKAGGRVITKGSIRELNTQFNEQLKALGKIYTEHGKKKSAPRRTKPGTGFAGPTLIGEEMKNFLAQANLGPSDPFNPASAPLNTVLQAAVSNVISRGILSPLMSIYTGYAGNNMKVTFDGKQYYRATPEMRANFGPALNALSAKTIMVGKKGEKKPFQLSAEGFRYADLQPILSSAMFKQDQLDEEQKQYLKNPVFAGQLDSEQKIFSTALLKHKAIDAAAKKGITKEAAYANLLAEKQRELAKKNAEIAQAEAEKAARRA